MLLTSTWRAWALVIATLKRFSFFRNPIPSAEMLDRTVDKIITYVQRGIFIWRKKHFILKKVVWQINRCTRLKIQGGAQIFSKSLWGFMLFGLNPQAGIFIYYYLGEICFGGPISYLFHPPHHLYAFKFFLIFIIFTSLSCPWNCSVDPTMIWRFFMRFKLRWRVSLRKFNF